jgi:glc operon protein GlcG
MMKSKTIERMCLSAEAVIEALGSGLSIGKDVGVAISISVVGPSMELLGFVRSDSATPHSAETSRRKAQTAASTRRATGWMPAGLAVELPMASGNLLTNIPGGTPVFVDGTFAGALGIAGGTVDQDAQVAEAVLAAIGAKSGK